jgi:hypothetical protein
MAGLLALSLANLIALAAPATHPAWGDRLRPGARFPIEGIAFEGRGGPLYRGDGLSDLAAALREAPWVRVRLEGFVDASEDAPGDERLARAMARETAERLVSLGVRPDRVAWSGRGGEAPLLPNFTARARSANRRVEVVVTNPSPGT